MKKIKVTWNGERMRDIYPHATKWQVLKFRVRRFIARALIVLKLGFIAVSILLITFWFGGLAYSSERVTMQDREVIRDTLSEKIEQLKEGVLNDLRACESGGAKESAGLITYDSNKVASIGSYQFQVKTVQHYYKSLYQSDITQKEAVLIALDDVKARELAGDIIFKADGLKNWLNCANKNNLRSKLNTIDLLQND